MTLDNYTAQQRRALALGLVLVVILSVVFGVVNPLVNDYYVNQHRIQQLHQQLQRYNAKIASREGTIGQAADLKAQVLNSGIFSVQHSIPLALADLQEKIKHIVTTAGGELSSMQNLPQTTVEGLTKLGINASFTGKMRHIKTILYELESAKPYMIIENIKVFGARNERSKTNATIDDSNKVYVLLDIVTYMPPVKL